MSNSTTPSDVGLIPLTINTEKNRFFLGSSPGSPFESSMEEGHVPINRNNTVELNTIRQTLGRAVHPTAAWTQSRNGSRNTSFSSSRSNSRPSSQYECDFEPDELMLSHPGNLQFPQKDPDEEMEYTRLPTIPPQPQYTKRKNSSSKRVPHRKR